MTDDAEWRAAIRERHLREEIAVLEATNRVLAAALYDAAALIPTGAHS